MIQLHCFPSVNVCKQAYQSFNCSIQWPEFHQVVCYGQVLRFVVLLVGHVLKGGTGNIFTPICVVQPYVPVYITYYCLYFFSTLAF